jgi:RES domain-containing protein
VNLWRISKHSSLDGRGGRIASARWHSRGRPIVYFAEYPAGALCEALVHLELSPPNFPAHYALLKAEAAEKASTESVDLDALVKNWAKNYLVTRTIGDEWLASRRTALLRVPSVILPETFNLLLNPEHPDAALLTVVWHREYPWDERLLDLRQRTPTAGKSSHSKPD